MNVRIAPKVNVLHFGDAEPLQALLASDFARTMRLMAMRCIWCGMPLGLRCSVFDARDPRLSSHKECYEANVN